MTVSNATWLALDVAVGQAAGSAGTLTMIGATNDWDSLNIAVLANSTGTVWMSDTQLEGTNSASFVGNTGSGRMTVSNGTWLASTVIVGSSPGAAGTLTIVGGNHSFYTALTLGHIACTAVGQVQLTSGQLFVTNTAVTAKLEVRNGTFTLSGGTLIVN